jgi:hypothetical protein
MVNVVHVGRQIDIFALEDADTGVARLVWIEVTTIECLIMFA